MCLAIYGISKIRYGADNCALAHHDRSLDYYYIKSVLVQAQDLLPVRLPLPLLLLS